MGNIIPFFYYDLLARVVPGGLTLFVLAYMGVELPEPWVPFFLADTAWGAVVIPLVLAGSSYAIGVLYEVLLSFLGLRCVREWLAKVAFDRAFRHEHGIKYGWRHPVELKKLVRALKKDGIRRHQWLKSLNKIRRHIEKATDQKNGRIEGPGKLRWSIQKRERELRFAYMNKLTHEGIADKAVLLAHSIRLQAEARMCWHCVVPMAVFCGYAVWEYYCNRCTQQWWHLVIGIALLVLLTGGAYTREWRRWLQVVISVKYMLP
ncbi:MAG: hypothetical protein O7D91_13345 [Planctomycetota bacterium]|nr:hypothetical protein [Planctomycetota bacterium]